MSSMLSIIVPVYNKESYLGDCIQSILNQTFTDFELILVNDGSTDGSQRVCKMFQENDERIRLVDQENQGVSAARNAGLELSTGKYIGFIDSDDTIEPDMYELLVRNAEETVADISVCMMKVVFPDKTVEPKCDGKRIVLDHNQALAKCLCGELERSANNKIYRAELLADKRFKGSIYEDVLFTGKVFLEANTTVFESVVKYNYIVRDSSVSMSQFNHRYLETVNVSAALLNMVTQKNPKCIPEAQAFDITANLSLINLIMLAGLSKYKNHYEEAISRLRNYRSFINESSLVRKKHRYASALIFKAPKFYAFCMYIYCRLTNAEAIKRT